jgi:hypothetical protein
LTIFLDFFSFQPAEVDFFFYLSQGRLAEPPQGEFTTSVNRHSFFQKIKMPSAGRLKAPIPPIPAEFFLICWRKKNFSVLYFYCLGLFFEMIHEPLSLEEGTLEEADSAYLVLDRREEVRQAA